MCKLWYRKRNPTPGTWEMCWAAMPYFPRSYQECEQLIDIYEEKWGNHYSYRIESAATQVRPCLP